MIRIGVLGPQGKMGQWVQNLLRTEFSSKAVFTQTLSDADVVIDFSSPKAVIDFMRQDPLAVPMIKKIPAMVVGSTGWNDDQQSKLTTFAKKTRVLQSSNFSIGFYTFLQSLKTTAPGWIEKGYQIKIVETHHIHKKDSPSGSAVLIRNLLKPLLKSPGEIPIQSQRVGEIIGDHEVHFEGPGDRIIFKHTAKDRSIFARGAIEAALWLTTQPKTIEKILTLENFLSTRP